MYRGQVMGWKTINNKRYYYHMTTINGVTQSTYKGNGIDALLCEYIVAQRKAAREQRKADNAALVAQIELDEQSLIQYHESMTDLYRVWKIAEGFHLHSGVWRKRGMVTRRPIMTQSSANIMPPSHDEIMKAIEKEKVRREFAAGNVDQLIKRYRGNPAVTALECLLSAIGDDAYHHQEACRRKFRKLRQALAGPDPNPIVELLASRVALAWFDVHFADASFYVRMNLDDFALVESFDRRRHRASRRLNQAIKQLSDVQNTTSSDVYRKMPRFEFMSAVGAN
jgi:hypothetical protein